jgi:hypothetical protein
VTLRVPEVGPTATVAEVKGMRLWTPRCVIERAVRAGAVAAEAVDATAVPVVAATIVAAVIRTAFRGRPEECFLWEKLFTGAEVKSLMRISQTLKMTGR